MAERTAIRRLRASIEPAGSYAVDRTGTIANFFDLRHRSAQMGRGVTALPDESVVQRLFKRYLTRFGFKTVSLDFSAPLVSTNQILVNGTSPTKTAQSKVLEAMCGGYQADEGSLVASGASTTGVTVTAAQGGRFLPGTIVGVETATADRYEVAKVKTRSTDALTFATALSFTPGVGKKVINAQQIYPGQIAIASATFLQFLLEGEDRDDIWLALGCQGTLGLSWPLGGEAMWSAQFAGSKWLHDDEIATPQGGSPIAAATLDGSAPIPITAGSAILTPISGTTRTLPTIDDLELTTGLTWQPVPSHNGVEGVAQMALVRGEQPTLSMSILADDESWTDVREAETKYQFLAQAGNVGGKMLALECGTMQLVAEPTKIEKNGVDWWKLTWGLLEDENCDDAGSDLERAPWRVAQL